MDAMTERLGLPMIYPGQAMKEATHNEALALIDLAAQPVVVEIGRDAPPVAPGLGDCWIVGANPGAEWAGQAGAIAGWTAGGWRFVRPREGFSVWNRGDAGGWRFDGAAWVPEILRGAALRIGDRPMLGGEHAAIDTPSGGQTIDAQARSTIAQILITLRSHGLIDRD